MPDLNETIQDIKSIPRWRKRILWKPFMEKHNCQVICEIGVRDGKNFYRMIDHNPKIAVAIDVWKDDGVRSRNDGGFTQQELDRQYEFFKSTVVDKPFVQLYREYSHDAVRHFPDEYFDLIYIDADHTYEGCKCDLEDWYPKVKTGRFFTGDDYYNAYAHQTGVVFGVIQAVDEFAKKMGREIHIFQNIRWAIIK